MARASLRPQPSAASRSGALMMLIPPICSLLSMNGPSVVTISPPCWRRTVAVLARMQPTAEHPRAGRLHFGVYRVHVAHDPLQDIGRRLRAAGRVTHAEQVLFHGICLVAGDGRRSAPIRTAGCEFRREPNGIDAAVRTSATAAGGTERQGVRLECRRRRWSARNLVAFARHLVVALREGLDEDVRQACPAGFRTGCDRTRRTVPSCPCDLRRELRSKRVARSRGSSRPTKSRKAANMARISASSCARGTGEGVAQPVSPRRSGGCHAP